MNDKNKPNVKPISQFVKENGKPTPKDIVAEANAAQAAKVAAAEAEATKQALEASKGKSEADTPEQAKEPVEAKTEAPVDVSEPVTPEEAEQAKIQALIDTTRKDSDDWAYILKYKKEKGLKTDAQLAEVFKVTVSNIQQQRNKAKGKVGKTTKKEEPKLSPSSMVEDALQLMKLVEGDLEAFDTKIAEAKALVDNAANERKKIEERKNKYVTIVELLGSDEDKAKAKAIAEEANK